MKNAMRNLTLVALAIVATATLAFAATPVAHQAPNGQIIVTRDNIPSGTSLVWPNRNYADKLDCWEHPFDIKDNGDGTCNVSVYLQVGATFHQTRPVELSTDWKDYEVYLGMNFLSNPGRPAVPSQNMRKAVLLGHPWESEPTRVEFTGIKVPKVSNDVVLLTLPTIYQGKSTLRGEDADYHPWGHIQWFMDGYYGHGPISAYAIKYNPTTGRYMLAGHAKQSPPPMADRYYPDGN